MVLGKVLVWALFTVTLLVTPLWSLDPINPIKMLALCSMGFAGIGILISNKDSFNFRKYKIPLVASSCFLIWQVIVIFVNGGLKLQQFYGAIGRNTGFITYLGFAFLFVISLLVANSVFLEKFTKTVFIVGLASLTYGGIQILGRDPFDWVNSYSPVIGFLGNPNFQSSLLGIFGSYLFASLIAKNVKNSTRVAYIVYLLVSIVVIYQTKSQQGFLILLIGSFIALLIFVKSISYKLLSLIVALGLMCLSTGILGLMNKGPFSEFLFDDSLAFRGDYWQAGWKMTLLNPIFGVGLDSYGDWYRRTRTLEATLRRGPDITSNAAHNVLIDLSSTGGFPLFVAYMAILILVIISIIKVVQRSHTYNASFASLVAGWSAFQIQSLVSINQIGLAIWGWALSGLIIGYEINTRFEEAREKKLSGEKKGKSLQISAGTTLGMFVGLAFGLLISSPPYLASAQYRSALETGNPIVIQKAAYLWPFESARFSQVAATLNDNGLTHEGLQVAVDGVNKFPDSFGAWLTLNTMKDATNEQKREAQIQMKRLDPLNPNLK